MRLVAVVVSMPFCRESISPPASSAVFWINCESCMDNVNGKLIFAAPPYCAAEFWIKLQLFIATIGESVLLCEVM